MVQKPLAGSQTPTLYNHLCVVLHSQVCKKLQVSSSTLFDMIARGQFPKPFSLIPNGRSVGWLEHEVDQWILSRKKSFQQESV